MHPLIPQAIGILAVALFLLCYQFKRRRAIILCNALSRALYILQYLLLGAIAGAVLDILGLLCSLVAQRKDTGFVRRHTRAIFIALNLSVVAAGVTLAILRRAPLDLLPIFGVLLHTGAFWLGDEKRIRAVSLAGSPFWLVYNLASRAYGSAVGDALTIGSILLAMLRYRKTKRDQT